MSYLSDLGIIFSIIFIVINHMASFKQTYLSLLHFLGYLQLFLDDHRMKKANNFEIAECCLAFA